jgi:sugar phosphate isomerase/epimerase
MYLSLSTWLFDHLPAEQVIAHAKACGYRDVEISGVNWPNLWKWNELLALCRGHGITVRSVHCVHHEHPKLNEDDAGFQRYHEEFYRSMGKQEGLILVEHVSMRRQFLERSRWQLGVLANLCGSYGYVLTTENLPDAPQEQMETLRSLLEGLVQFTFDAAHAAYARLDPLQFLRFADRMVNVHAYDVSHAMPLGDWLPCGLGDMKWPDIIAALRRIKYQGPVTVELNERNLRRVLGACRKAVEKAKTPNCTAPTFDAQIEDAFAIYSREYLSPLLKGE